MIRLQREYDKNVTVLKFLGGRYMCVCFVTLCTIPYVCHDFCKYVVEKTGSDVFV